MAVGSGVIYAGIVLAWAAFLVPMWLRRHDERADARAADGFSAAMRVLARRQGAAAPDAAAPGAASSGDGAPGTRRLHAPYGADHTGSRSTGSLPVRLRRRFRSGGSRPVSAAARRRRLLAVLTALVVLTATGAVLGRLAPALVAPPVLLLAGYVALLVATARLRAAALAAPRHGRVARQLPPLSRTLDVPAGTPALSTSAASAPVHRSPAAERVDPVADDHVLRPHSPAAEVQPVEISAPAAAATTPAPAAADPDGWQPVPVPVPTYVTAPKAQRTIRTIDLSSAGSWTSGHLAEPEAPDRSDEELPAWAGAPSASDDTLDRRAVND